MKHLFLHLSEIQEKLEAASRVLLLLDYDGTLTPIVPSPEDALLDTDTRQILQSLAGNGRFVVGVISGRELSQTKELVGIPSLYYAGNHGLEMSGPNFVYTNPSGIHSRSVLNRIVHSLQEKLNPIEGVLLEDKGLTLAVHYRMVEGKAARRKVKRIFASICQPYLDQGYIHIAYGKKVMEIRPPVDWHKGQAVLLLKKHAGEGIPLCTIYIGDDLTDEDAFRVMSPWDISVCVGTRKRSEAGYFLKNPQEVKEFLYRLKENIWRT